jgi:alpha/beta superfamily hydrolase
MVLVGPAVLNFQTPTVPKGSCVVHGEADDVVPLAAVLDWARPQFQPVCVVPGAGHFFHGQLPLLKQIVTDALVARLFDGATA